jgi:hypothetical protein
MSRDTVNLELEPYSFEGGGKKLHLTVETDDLVGALSPTLAPRPRLYPGLTRNVQVSQAQLDLAERLAHEIVLLAPDTFRKVLDAYQAEQDRQAEEEFDRAERAAAIAQGGHHGD